jgi:hypothetical protein
VAQKNRSAGVTVIAVLALLGSALMLALAVLVAIAMFVAPPSAVNPAPLPPMFYKVLRVAAPLFYALPAVWGIVTAVDLLRLRNWARISTIVFSVLLIVFGGFGMLTSVAFFLMPPPGRGLDAKVLSYIGVATGLIALIQVGIGIWWLVFFNRPRVKAQFVPSYLQAPASVSGEAPYRLDMPYSATLPPPGPPGEAPGPVVVAPRAATRPLSISIIAWYLLASCLFIPFSLFLHSPTFLFTAILTGWRATVFFLVYTALIIYIGTALLRMKPAGRLTAIGYFIFTFVNLAVFYFAPGGRARMAKLLDLQQSMFPWMRSSQDFSPFGGEFMPFIIIGAIAGLVLWLVPLYFLVVAKPAFDKAARAQGD